MAGQRKTGRSGRRKPTGGKRQPQAQPGPTGGEQVTDPATGATNGNGAGAAEAAAAGQAAPPAAQVSLEGATLLGGAATGAAAIGQMPPQALGMNPQQQAAVNEAVERVGMFGQVVWLMMQSPAHKHLFLNDMEWLVLPPIQANQFRLWQQNGMPIVYASWAWLDADAEARMKANIKKLAPMDWPRATAGDTDESLWLIDLIAPFGGMEEAINDLKENVFQGQTVKMLQPGPGGGMATVEW